MNINEPLLESRAKLWINGIEEAVERIANLVLNQPKMDARDRLAMAYIIMELIKSQ